jgi:hypothetical protein
MGSSGKKKTTMAKLTRERKLRERRIDKQAKKDARKHAAADDSGLSGDTLTEEDGQELAEPGTEPDTEPGAEPVAEPGAEPVAEQPIAVRAFTDA